ncbi:unnamed protein product [Ambrosiozyma monospora]|uniref:Unnamed protein product n=1 Tax=Ambrosiozyma monospora TaxID=43982 RepID=A0A9W6Z6A1_AMBMO|nr:unnamed protein product [Ambrosiozyma monospora]
MSIILVAKDVNVTTFQPSDQPFVTIHTLGREVTYPNLKVRLQFSTDNSSFEHLFTVVPDSAVLIIGYDFIRTHSSILPLNNITTTTSSPPPNYDHMIEEALTTYHDAPLELPPRRPSDYIFQLTDPLSSLTPRPPIKSDLKSQEFLQAEVNRLLSLGFIRRTNPVSHYAVPFVTWAGKKPRMVIDFRPLNSITVPLPSSLTPFNHLVTSLHGTIMSTLDLSQAYHHLRLHPATEHYATFRVGHDFYCWRVLPFGAKNSGEAFCEFVSSVFADLQFVKFFLDDAIIVSNTPEEHLEHLKIVLTRLTENKLHLNVEKSHFFQTTVDWVGHSVSASPDGIISISPLDSTIETIKNFPRPTCKKDIQTFLGHLAYISEFIPHYADLTAPLSSLLGKDVRFSWTDECQSAFTNLIALEAKQMSLHPFSPSLPIKLTTDASKVAVGAVLWQLHNTTWLPVEYRSMKLKKAQLNWSTLEKELYAIKFAVERFKYFVANRSKILVHTDHKPIVSLFTSNDLSAKLQRWLAELVPYNLEIHHIAGITNGPADHLSRLPIYNFHITTSPAGPWLSSLVKNYASDPVLASIYDDPSSCSGFSIDPESQLLYKDATRLCIPHDNLQELLDAIHASPTGGHMGVTRTIAYLTKSFYFPRLRAIVEKYVGSCDVCQRVKSKTHTPGHMQAIPTPAGRWTEISVDVVSGFSSVPFLGSTIDSVLVVVDLFSSHVHFHPINKSFSHKDFANILLMRHFPLHGIPSIIHSDQGSQFTHHAMQALLLTLLHPRK